MDNINKMVIFSKYWPRCVFTYSNMKRCGVLNLRVLHVCRGEIRWSTADFFGLTMNDE